MIAAHTFYGSRTMDERFCFGHVASLYILSDEVIVAVLAALCEIDDNWTPQHNSNSKQNLRG